MYQISQIQQESNGAVGARFGSSTVVESSAAVCEEHKTVLEVQYSATTNRMLRVAVNGFMESLGVVLGVMEELDIDVCV